MEAKKSHDVLSASWKSSKASGTIQFEFKGLRIRSSEVEGQEKIDVPAQGKREFALLLPFGSIQTLKG